MVGGGGGGLAVSLPASGIFCDCEVESDIGYRGICEGLFLDNVMSGVYCWCDGSVCMSVCPDLSVLVKRH